jgi:membrane protein implicated in regulation of membrane protease activity
VKERAGDGMLGINMFVIWLIALVILAVFEMVTVALVSIWFCFGALSAMLLALFGYPVWLQLLSFVLISALLLILTRPFIKKLFRQKEEKTNIDLIIGSTAVVTGEIDNNLSIGEISALGKVWPAKSFDSSVIGKDIKVVVIGIEGMKAIVKPCDEN